jgi:hypothetical protein
MKSTIRHAILTALMAFVSLNLYAQTVLTPTTLSAAVLSGTETNIAVASATGIAAPVAGVATYLFTDREQMQVVSVSGTNVRVIRGVNSTRAAQHVSGATVYVGPPAAFRSGTSSGNVPTGRCTRTDLQYVPVILVGGDFSGRMYDCLGVTSAGQYVLVSEAGPPVLGSAVASVAGVITPTGTAFVVSGALAITGITLPAGFAPGNSIYIIPSGTFTWTTATNIAIAGTAVVNKTLIFTWSGSKWIPSYLS